MKILKNKKWNTYLISTSVLFLVILIFEIGPRLFDVLSNSASLVWDLYNTEDEETVAIQLEEDTLLNNRIKSRVNNFVSDYNENKNISPFIKLLSEQAAQSKLKIISINSKKISKEKDLWKQGIELNLEGSFTDYFNFITNLENSQKVVSVQSMDIKPVRLNRPLLNINLQLDVYLNL
ncbi:MAG: type 4a pilus biogenesis protein PilO [Ignavibacteria bacterium]|jgi:hypothetical protein